LKSARPEVSFGRALNGFRHDPSYSSSVVHPFPRALNRSALPSSFQRPAALRRNVLYTYDQHGSQPLIMRRHATRAMRDTQTRGGSYDETSRSSGELLGGLACNSHLVASHRHQRFGTARPRQTPTIDPKLTKAGIKGRDRRSLRRR
jgi:hypothetical protein